MSRKEPAQTTIAEALPTSQRRLLEQLTHDLQDPGVESHRSEAAPGQPNRAQQKVLLRMRTDSYPNTLSEAAAETPNQGIASNRDIVDTNDHLELHIKENESTPSGGHIVEATLIRAGTSTNGNHYSDALLRESAPLFDGARAFADHASPHMAGSPRSVRDLVGHYRNPRFQPGSGSRPGAGGKIRADLYLLPGNDWLWGIIQEAQSHPDLCGLSIDAKGEVKMGEVAGQPVRIVESFRKINSIDVVSRPAAGGSLDRILASEQALPSVPATSKVAAGTQWPAHEISQDEFDHLIGKVAEAEPRTTNQKPRPENPCPTCDGSGSGQVDFCATPDHATVGRCPTCNGSGSLTEGMNDTSDNTSDSGRTARHAGRSFHARGAQAVRHRRAHASRRLNRIQVPHPAKGPPGR